MHRFPTKSLVVLLAICTPVIARETLPGFKLALDAGEYVIGAPVKLAVAVPASAKPDFFDLYVVENGAEPRYLQRLYKDAAAKGQQLALTAPAHPGDHEFQLRHDKTIYASAAFTAQATRTPGAIRLPKATFQAGESFEMVIKLPEGRYYDSPRWGLWSAGERVPGGAVVAPYWHSWVYVDKGTHTVTAPSQPGKYQIRLFDRNAGHYEIDSVAFNVIVEKAPGAIKLSKPVYRAGEKMTISITFPKNRCYDSPRLAVNTIPQAAPGGAEIAPTNLHWVYVGDKPIEITAPSMPGTYGVALYDRNSSSYQIDATEFSVVVEPAPGAIQIERNRYVVGAPIPVKINLPPDRYYDSPAIWLFAVASEVPGGAIAGERDLQKQYVNTKEGNIFTAPETPGRYELRLHDRNNRYYILDRASFEVGVTEVKSVIAVNKPQAAPGEKLTFTINPPAGRYYSSPVVHLMRRGYEVRGGATVTERFFEKWYFDPSDKKTHVVTFDAPAEAGGYELRVLDRNAHYYILGAVPFEVVSPRLVNLALGEARETPLPGEDQPLPLPNRDNLFNVDNGQPPSALERTENEVAAAQMGKKAADFYLDLEEILKKPQDEWTADDARTVAAHLVGMLPERFEPLKEFFEKNTQGVENAREVIGLAGDAWYILNPDPNDPLWELRAFHRYLGMMRKIADKVPGVGQFYGQYVDAVGSMITSAQRINEGRERTNRSIELWNDVLEGTYKTAPQRERLDREFNHFLGGVERMRARAGEEMSDADRANIENALAGVERPWRNIVFDIRIEMEALDRAYGHVKDAMDLTEARRQQARRRNTTVEQLYSAEQLRETRRDLLAARHQADTARSALARLQVREQPLRRAYLEQYHYVRSLALMRSRPELGRLDAEELRRRAQEQAGREAAQPLAEMFRYGVTLPRVRPNPEQL